MVKNREELLQVAKANADMLKTHLRHAIGEFLKIQKVSPSELAYVLGINDAEMRQILEGNGNVTVDVLSKLLVATDMAVEIKPVTKTPLRGYGKGMPRSGGFPGPNGIPVDENGNIMPPPPGWPHPEFMGGFPPRKHEERAADDMREVPMETSGPMRDSHGRFMKKPKPSATIPQNRPTKRPESSFLGLSNAELANIIRQNIWDGEIDLNTANHEQLAAFVANKERIMRERAEQPKRDVEPKTPVNGGGETLNQFVAMLGNIAKEAENNPALMDAINRFMPRK